MKTIVVALIALLFPLLTSAQTPPMSITPSATDGGTPALLKWAIPGALSCTASGLWSGVKPASGQNMVTPSATGKYVLTCAMPAGTGTALVRWDPVSQNTDNTPLTDLSGYKIYWGASASTLNKSVAVPASPTIYTVEGLTPGPYVFGVTTLSGSSKAESVMSVTVSDTVVAAPAPPVTASADVTVTVLPKPPANLTVTAIAYEYRPATNTFAAIGLVAPGAACGPVTKQAGTVTYCRVALANSLPVVWPTDRTITEVWVRM